MSYCFHHLWGWTKKKKKKERKSNQINQFISSISAQGTSVISPIIPLLSVVLFAFIISQKSVENVFETYPSLYIITFGMFAAKVTNKLVVSWQTLSYFQWKFQINVPILSTDCPYDQKWNGLFGLRPFWSHTIIFKSIF